MRIKSQNGDDALASTSGHVMVGLIGAKGEPDPLRCELLHLAPDAGPFQNAAAAAASSLL